MRATEKHSILEKPTIIALKDCNNAFCNWKILRISWFNIQWDFTYAYIYAFLNLLNIIFTNFDQNLNIIFKFSAFKF